MGTSASLERGTCKNIGHLSVFQPTVSKCDKVKGITSVYSRPSALPRHVYTILSWNMSFVPPCRLVYRLEFGWISNPPTTALSQRRCYVNWILVQSYEWIYKRYRTWEPILSKRRSEPRRLRPCMELRNLVIY
jgi:hypothetical protein